MNAFQRRICSSAVLALLSHTAFAHDTWFEAKAQQRPGRLIMALGTGNRYPVFEYPLGLEQLSVHGCRQGGQTMALQGMAATAKTLLLLTQSAGAGPVSCWAQTIPFEIELAADKIAIYLDEINASPAVRTRWAALAARGLPWREQYTKNARIEFSRGPAANAAVTAPQPSGMGMDILLASGLRPLRSGDALAFQLLRDGAALADFALELQSAEAPAAAQWLRTDNQGWLRVSAPAAGRWLLRGTDLRASASRPDEWESRFITLAFEVGSSAGP
ncbi:hypothetical protein BH11PSE10_BH11PSE10_10620 [soil metagenome]